ncbi:TPA_asm: hypothetical protein GEJ72_11645 [Listeria monocytogenes]|uniref:hypothetical protein n=1 Tax=Listeria monocytogenes TaxID=1639 RepID=UPI000D73C7D2|nr:hypothetical protein [Listeria monocytogenes]EAC8114320.1 hypothetical protein [Listeria monocytogenes]EAD6333027.1 hypothetical protein [Listeria monocytogenes]EAE9951296.1 hypothetical protein [Listeria monocytogenes]EAE9957495.1 hypothetical protein [Listeria monocytogenes]EAE9969011.1 hypothetical protein [Listeria monocytogenes]
MKGAFQMSREIFENDIWSDVIKFRLFFYIVGNAVFSENGVMKGGIQIGRGQYLRSFRNLREDLLYYDNNAEKFYSLSTIKEKIDELVREERLEITTTKLGTLFTVRNYALYQDLNNYSGTSSERLPNSHRTATEQPPNNKKNVKKDKNDNKDNNKRQNKFDEVHLSLANLLFEMIKSNNPEEKNPDIEKWAHDLRIMIEQDKREPEKVKNAIIWSQENDFWCSVIKSPKSLRRNYDKMATQRNKPVASKPFNKYSKQTKPEVLPDWFDKEQKQTKQETSTTESSEDLEKKVAEIKAKLAARSEVQA